MHPTSVPHPADLGWLRPRGVPRGDGRRPGGRPPAAGPAETDRQVELHQQQADEGLGDPHAVPDRDAGMPSTPIWYSRTDSATAPARARRTRASGPGWDVLASPVQDAAVDQVEGHRREDQEAEGLGQVGDRRGGLEGHHHTKQPGRDRQPGPHPGQRAAELQVRQRRASARKVSLSVRHRLGRSLASSASPIASESAATRPVTTPLAPVAGQPGPRLLDPAGHGERGEVALAVVPTRDATPAGVTSASHWTRIDASTRARPP